MEYAFEANHALDTERRMTRSPMAVRSAAARSTPTFVEVLGDLLPAPEFSAFFRPFEEYLSRRGHRMTTQRQTIGRLCFEIQSPFSAERIIVLARGLPDGERVSKPTVYRTLYEFTDAGILLSDGDGDERVYSRV